MRGVGVGDTFRELYPKKIKYSWWSYRSKARERNAGWRIDYFVVSNRLMKKVKDSIIYDDVACVGKTCSNKKAVVVNALGVFWEEPLIRAEDALIFYANLTTMGMT